METVHEDLKQRPERSLRNAIDRNRGAFTLQADLAKDDREA
ncbi:MAG: hypothetical protein JWL77_7136 [Chthonomonadaceae bacterium]|nr:hypothetical protein [Chthonomonadaceae bacterium]